MKNACPRCGIEASVDLIAKGRFKSISYAKRVFSTEMKKRLYEYTWMEFIEHFPTEKFLFLLVNQEVFRRDKEIFDENGEFIKLKQGYNKKIKEWLYTDGQIEIKLEGGLYWVLLEITKFLWLIGYSQYFSEGAYSSQPHTELHATVFQKQEPKVTKLIKGIEWDILLPSFDSQTIEKISIALKNSEFQKQATKVISEWVAENHSPRINDMMKLLQSLLEKEDPTS